MIKMKDIAKIAGVSEATVSRALNNKGEISSKTKSLILKIIEEHNYVPNSVARSLYTNSTNIVGVIVPDIINPYFPEVIQTIEITLSGFGYNVMLFNTLNNEDVENHHLRTITSLNLAGLIIIAPNISSKKYETLQIPMVSIDGILNNKIPYVISDFYNGARTAVQMLIKNQCRSLLHVSGPLVYYSSFERCNGFIEECDRNRIGYKVLQTNLDTSDFDMIKSYFNEHREIDGIFAANDSIAFTCIRALSELQIRVPDEIKIIGYDNNFMANVVNPPLSTIAVPIQKIGTEASLILVNMIRDQPYQRDNVLDVSFIQRNTTL